jgi:hypothetical protein
MICHSQASIRADLGGKMNKACAVLIASVAFLAAVPCGVSQEPKPIEGALKVDKVSPPKSADLKTAQKAVRETFAAELKAAKIPQAKSDLAGELAQKVRASKNPADSEYAFGMEAIELYVSIGDGLSAFRVVDDLALTFDLPVIATKAALFKRAAKEAKAPAQKRVAALVGLKLAGDAASAEEYEVAKDLATLSLSLARPSRDASVVKRATDQQAKYTDIYKFWSSVKEARAKLKADATDAEANETVGRYLCFVRQDWKQGLPFLKEAFDAELKATAAQDLSLTNDEGALTAADAWWEVAEHRKKERQQILPRCAFWYEKAIPNLTAIPKANAEKRLQAVYEAISGRNYAKIVSEAPNGVLAVGVVDCANAMVPVTLQPTFDLQRSWLLSLQVFTTELPGGPHMVFSWSDGRPGRDVFMLGWNNNTFGFSLEDCIKGGGQSINIATTPAEHTGRWMDVKVVLDSISQELEFYVDNRLIQRDPLTIIPRVDQAMPLYLGGADGAGYRFTGQVRNVWLGNIK